METLSRYLLTFLLNAIWQIPLVAGAAALICRFLRQGPARHRHAVYAVALLAAVILPMASLQQWSAPSPVASVTWSPQLASVPPTAPLASRRSASAAPASSTRTIWLARNTAALLLGGYLIFLLFRVARLAWACMRTARIRGTARLRIPPAVVEAVSARCQAALGARDVELLCSAGVSGPVTAGGAIILPVSLLEEPSEEVLAAAIGHEMAHIVRRDFAFNLLYEAISLPISFHPATHILLRGIERTREMACDEMVTERLMAPGVYARAIVSVAAAMTALPNPGYSLGVFDGNILEDRIRRLMERPAASLKRARLFLAAGISALAVCAVMASALAISARAQTDPHALQMAEESFARGDVAAARKQYLDILARDLNNAQATRSMTALAIHEKQFVEARQWALRQVQLDAKDTTGYYSAGFADWAFAYPGIRSASAALGMKPEDFPFIADSAVRQKLRGQYQAVVEDGLRMEQLALQVDPHYSDAMAYINLLYRLQASLAETREESQVSVATADEWVNKALAARKYEQANRAPAPAANPAPGPPPPPPPPPPPSIPDNQPASADPAHDDRLSPQGYLWQVVGSGGEPAKALAQALRDKGFRAFMFSLRSGQNLTVRILVGPYPDRPSLEQAKSALEAAGFRTITER